RLTRLKADSRSCRNIQSKPQGGLSIKIEGRVSLREMIVAANLDWPIAGICNFEGNYCAGIVKDDLTCRGKNLAGDHLEHSTEQPDADDDARHARQANCRPQCNTLQSESNDNTQGV